MITIQGKDGSTYQYQESLGVIIKDGTVQSTSDYEPLYFPESSEFSGIYNKKTNEIISMSGDIGGAKSIGEL